MDMIKNYFRDLYQGSVAGWNRFWFTPSDMATLGVIRICAGAMLFYTHAVWSLRLEAFFGPQGYLNSQAEALALGQSHTWSWFWLIESPAVLWSVHIAALVVFAMLTLGVFTRVVSVLAFAASLSYVHRVQGALFGLDQLNCMLAMYLMLGPAGEAYSLDRLWKRWKAGGKLNRATPSISANISLRLIQFHMCVIYFFAGLSKFRGESWWDGTAFWGAVANLEYQSLDLTWLAHYPILVNLMTQVSIFWELFFCVLVWPRLLRPLVLFVAIPLHLGIAFGMGMITFGLIMLVGCSSFIPPELIRRWIERRGEETLSGSTETGVANSRRNNENRNTGGHKGSRRDVRSKAG